MPSGQSGTPQPPRSEGERLLTAQRDEAKAEADRLFKVGGYLAAALRFYVPNLSRADYREDPFYKDAHMALAAWEQATEESNHA